MNRLEPDGQYRPGSVSLAFPGVEPADVAQFVERGRTTDKLQWVRELRAWVRDVLVPRRNRNGHGV